MSTEANVPEAFLLTYEDLFAPAHDSGEANFFAVPSARPKTNSKPKPVRRLAAAHSGVREMEGGAPKVWATVNVDRLLAFSERYQPEQLAPGALADWFRTLASQPLVASYKDRGRVSAILALGFEQNTSRADPFFDLPGEPVPVSLGIDGTSTRVQLCFQSERDFWIRSRREVILVAPSSPSESLRACRIFVEFGCLDANGCMTYSMRPAPCHIVTPDLASSHPAVQIHRQAA